VRRQDVGDLHALEGHAPVKKSEDADSGGREVDTTGNIAGVARRPDAPWTWDVPLIPSGNWSLRIHISLLLLVLLQILRAAIPAATVPVPSEMRAAVIVLVMVCWCVLLQDVAREFVSRRCGALPCTMSLTPWGGVRWNDPPGPWVNRLAAAAVGPVVLSLGVGLAAGALALRRQPLSWEWLPSPMSDAGFHALETDWISALLWLGGWTASMVLFVSLLPFHPMPGGRILESLLEARMNRADARERTLWVGTGLALLGCVIAIATNSLLALLACGVGLAVSSRGGKLLRLGLQPRDPSDDQRDADVVRERRAAKSAEEEQRLDRLLGKIAKDGMGALSWRERRFLRSATRRKRG